MTWTRTDTIALASMRCQSCRGLGLCLNSREEEVPCTCVLRAIFRLCYQRFRHAVMSPKDASTVQLERGGQGPSGRVRYGRKTEEFIADFNLISRRTLRPAEWQIFSARYLLGGAPSFVAGRLRMESSNFSGHCSRIEAKLGRAFRETEPFALFPLDEYFSDPALGAHAAAISAPLASVVQAA